MSRVQGDVLLVACGRVSKSGSQCIAHDHGHGQGAKKNEAKRTYGRTSRRLGPALGSALKFKTTRYGSFQDGLPYIPLNMMLLLVSFFGRTYASVRPGRYGVGESFKDSDGKGL